MKAASLAAGQGETFVRDILERDRKPSIQGFISLSAVLGISLSKLKGLKDEWDYTVPLPVLGALGEGGRIEPLAPNASEGERTALIPIRSETHGFVVVHVLGDGHAPRYEDGDEIVLGAPVTGGLDAYLNELAVAATVDGTIAIGRIIMRNSGLAIEALGGAIYPLGPKSWVRGRVMTYHFGHDSRIDSARKQAEARNRPPGVSPKFSGHTL